MSVQAARLAMPNAEQSSFTLDQLKALTRPCVYLFVKADEILYCGSSNRGALRFAGTDHAQSDVRELADEILVFWFKKEWHARNAEQSIIRKFKPRFNGRGRAWRMTNRV